MLLVTVLLCFPFLTPSFLPLPPLYVSPYSFSHNFLFLLSVPRISFSFTNIPHMCLLLFFRCPPRRN